MTRPSIKTSLLSLFVIVLLLFGIVAYFAINGLSATNRSTETIATNWLPSVKVSQTIALNMANLRVAYRDHVIAQTDTEKKEREAAIPKVEAALRQSIDEYFKLISSDRERELLNIIKASADGYIAASPQLLRLSRANKTEEASKYMGGEMLSLSAAVNTSVKALVDLHVEGSKTASDVNKSEYQSVTLYLYAALGFAILLVIGAVIFTMASIAAPITRITVSMRSLAAGDTNSPIPFAERADEIGTMAEAVEVFRQAAIANKRMETEAEESRRQAEADRVATQEQAEAAATERLRIATSGLASGLKKLASGDLAFQLPRPTGCCGRGKHSV